MRRCFGIKGSLSRCNREGNWWLFCEDHKRQPIKWLCFIVFTALAGICSIYGIFGNNGNADSKSQPIIEPKIECILNYSGENEPFVIVTNDGPSKVHSFTLDVIQAVYFKNKDEILFIQSTPVIDGHLILTKELAPFQKEYRELALMKFKYGDSYIESINVYAIFACYYRDNDYKYIQLRKNYFIDNGEIYEEYEYKNNIYYSKLSKYIKNLDPKNQFNDEKRYKMLQNMKFDPKYINK